MVSLVLSETGGTVETGRRALTKRTVTLKTYDVVSDDGALIGTVAQEMATFERRSPGRRYVYARWQSPRWFYYVAGQRFGRRSMAYTTRKDAVRNLIEAARAYGDPS